MQQIAASTQRAARPSHNFSGSKVGSGLDAEVVKARSPDGTGVSSPRDAAAPARSPMAPGTARAARSLCRDLPSLPPSLPPSLLPSLYPSILSSPTTAAYYYNKMSHESTLVKPAGMLASMAGRP